MMKFNIILTRRVIRVKSRVESRVKTSESRVESSHDSRLTSRESTALVSSPVSTVLVNGKLLGYSRFWQKYEKT
jgi:hypothetical protein